MMRFGTSKTFWLRQGSLVIIPIIEGKELYIFVSLSAIFALHQPKTSKRFLLPWHVILIFPATQKRRMTILTAFSCHQGVAIDTMGLLRIRHQSFGESMSIQDLEKLKRPRNPNGFKGFQTKGGKRSTGCPKVCGNAKFFSERCLYNYLTIYIYMIVYIHMYMTSPLCTTSLIPFLAIFFGTLWGPVTC